MPFRPLYTNASLLILRARHPYSVYNLRKNTDEVGGSGVRTCIIKYGRLWCTYVHNKPGADLKSCRVACQKVSHFRISVFISLFRPTPCTLPQNEHPPVERVRLHSKAMVLKSSLWHLSLLLMLTLATTTVQGAIYTYACYR